MKGSASFSVCLQADSLSATTRSAAAHFLDLAYPWRRSGPATAPAFHSCETLAACVLPSLAREALAAGVRVGSVSSALADGSVDVCFYCSAESGTGLGAFVETVTFTLDVQRSSHSAPEPTRIELAGSTFKRTLNLWRCTAGLPSPLPIVHSLWSHISRLPSSPCSSPPCMRLLPHSSLHPFLHIPPHRSSTPSPPQAPILPNSAILS